ncbi:MAG: hypothetical protein BACC_01883 [Bacteroides sp.]
MLIISCISYNIIFSYFKNRIATESQKKSRKSLINKHLRLSYFIN